MYLDLVPMLSKGSFVRYYGGCELLKDAANAGSPISPMFMGVSGLFQLSMFIFKKMKMRKLNPHSGSPGKL